MIATYSVSVNRKCGLILPFTHHHAEVHSEEVHNAWWMGKTFPAISFQEMHIEWHCFSKGSSVNEQPRVFHQDSPRHMQQQCAVVVVIHCFRFILANGTSPNSLYLQKLLRIYLLIADIFQ
jgi:hypothetical protein